MHRTIGFLAALTALATPLLVAAPAQAAVYSAPLRTVVRQLPVAVENNVGYDRATWRYGSDTDGDCYNTRAEVLQQETRAGIVYTGCTAKTGRWLSYADNKIHTLASAVQIDHLVPLAEAHGSGGRAWTAARKKAFANDLTERRSLNAMTSTLNSSKQAKDPAEWLPPYAAARCRYITEWAAVKLRWRLSVDARERAQLIYFADRCTNVMITVDRV